MKSGGFLKNLGFTPNEQKVIFFLLIAFCVGGGIKYYYGTIRNEQQPRFDYSAIDGEFNERSHARQVAESLRIDKVSSLAGLPETRTRTIIKKLPADGSVDLNTSTKETLQALPGIGETTAKNIMLYRREHGRFTTIDELMNVRGIGEKKFLKLKPYLRIP